MRIVSISDTHSYHRQVNVPDGDLFIYAGDMSFKGELKVIADFSNWLKDLPHKLKVCIFGNHELGFRNGPKRNPAIQMIKDAGAIYLEDSWVMIEDYKIYGSPYTPFFYDWEWNLHRGQPLIDKWAQIPDDTNILVTHGPPLKILDGVKEFYETVHVGDADLSNRIAQLKQLKIHVYGHIHRENNEPPEEHNGIKYGNASILNNDYKIANDPIVIDL